MMWNIYDDEISTKKQQKLETMSNCGASTGYGQRSSESPWMGLECRR